MTFRDLTYRLLGQPYNAVAPFAPGAVGRALTRLFATPPKPALRPKEQAFLDAAALDRETLANVGGVVYQWGDPAAPYVLASYGWGYNAGRWRHYAPGLLAAGYRLVAYDPPGHGQAAPGTTTVPQNAAQMRQIVRAYGAPAGLLAHSFGGGSAVEAFVGLPPALRPQRAVLMAAFSRATWIFRNFKYRLGLTELAYRVMVVAMEKRLGLQLTDFDLARKSAQLGDIDALLVHDPADGMTHYRNAQRYHLYWPNSRLLPTPGAGHHLGDAKLTEQIVRFLTKGTAPATALEPQRPLAADHDLIRYFAGMEVDVVERPVRVP